MVLGSSDGIVGIVGNRHDPVTRIVLDQILQRGR